MKKIVAVSCFLALIIAGSVAAQCTSSPSIYNLIVTGNVSLAANGSQFLFGYVCTGGTLVDSTSCCTRYIHVESGGTYEAGPAAYGMVYLKSGATFDAHGNNNFFAVAYEAGAIILNYAGPQNLCTAIAFPTANCVTGINDNNTEAIINVYPNPSTGLITIDVPAGFENEWITICDITGKQILKPFQMKHRFQNTLDLSSLMSGIYYYSISGKKGFITQGKLMVIN